MSLSVFACKPNDPPIEESDPIVAVDGVNVQNIIEALGPMSESEYLTVNVEFGMESGEEIARGDAMSDAMSDAYSELTLLSA